MQVMSLLVVFSASLDGVTASGMFTSDDYRQSSAFRELKEIYYVLLLCGTVEAENGQGFHRQSRRC